VPKWFGSRESTKASCAFTILGPVPRTLITIAGPIRSSAPFSGEARPSSEAPRGETDGACVFPYVTGRRTEEMSTAQSTQYDGR
jgi:hypothetical protein